MPPEVRFVTVLKMEMVVLPQLSLAVGVSKVRPTTPHTLVLFPEHVMLGGLVSLTVMVWVQVALFPHGSVARYVRLMLNCPTQLLELIASPCQVTVTAPPQVSLVVTLLVFGAGTWLAQPSVRLAGHVILGGLVS